MKNQVKQQNTQINSINENLYETFKLISNCLIISIKTLDSLAPKFYKTEIFPITTNLILSQEVSKIRSH